MTDRPFLSICIPNFNMAQWLEGAVESALAQRPPDEIEVIVTDNASTDESVDVLARFRNDSRFRLDVNSEHVSMVDNWNRAFAHARGRWGVLLSADDLLATDFYINFRTALRNCPSSLLVSLAADVVNSEGTLTGIHGGDGAYFGHEGLRKLLEGNPYCLSTTAWDLGLVKQVGGFRPMAGSIADWDLWIRLLAQGNRPALAVQTIGGAYHANRGGRWSSSWEDGKAHELIGQWIVGLSEDLPHDIVREGRRALASRVTAPAVHDLAAGRRHVSRRRLTAGMRYGCGLPRVRAAIELCATFMPASDRLAAYRISRVQRRRASEPKQG